MSITDSKSRFESEVNSLCDSRARQRLAMLFDDGTFTEVDRFVKNNGAECEVVAAYGEINGVVVYAYAQSIDVNRGAMGKVQAAKISHLYDLATKTGAPIVSIFDSDGAHIDEGLNALEAYGSLIKAASKISGVVPQISVIAGPCVGSAAVLASMADVVVMTDEAELYITSPAFLSSDENDIGTSKLASKNGTAAVVTATDKDAINAVCEIITYLPANNLSEPLLSEYVQSVGGDAVLSVVDANSFFELYTDYGKCIKTGFARIGGCSVGIVSSVPEIADGYFCDEGAKKAAKFIRLCDAFSIPVVTFVDSLGIKASENSELKGGVKSVSMLTAAYSEATTPKVTIITGNAIAGAYIAFVSSAADSDFVFAWPQAVVGTLEPMTAVQFLYKDRLLNGEQRADLEAEYVAEKCSPFNAAALGLVSDVIEPEVTAAKVISALDVLSSKRVSNLSKKHSNILL